MTTYISNKCSISSEKMQFGTNEITRKQHRHVTIQGDKAVSHTQFKCCTRGGRSSCLVYFATPIGLNLAILKYLQGVSPIPTEKNINLRYINLTSKCWPHLSYRRRSENVFTSFSLRTSMQI